MIVMEQPASPTPSEPHDESELRAASFTPDEAQRLFEMKALYGAGWFAEDDPYKLPPS